jgi:DNA-binding response OmpR family regulator
MCRKKILVIDDEEFIRDLVKDFLEMEDIHTEGAETSEQGLKMMMQSNYNLILLDRNLGEGKAEGVIEQIRKINNDTPIIILTGDTECDEAHLKQIGAVEIVFKPFQMDEFVEKVKRFL